MSSQFATSNRVSLGYVRESVWGTPPALLYFIEHRYTSETLKVGSSTITSDEIRSDRMISNTIKVEESPSGDINGEFSYRTYDQIIESVMFSFWKYSTVQTISDHEYSAFPLSKLTDGSNIISSTHDAELLSKVIIKPSGSGGNIKLCVKQNSTLTITDFDAILGSTAHPECYLGVITDDGTIRRGRVSGRDSTTGTTVSLGSSTGDVAILTLAVTDIDNINIAYPSDTVKLNKFLDMDYTGDQVTLSKVYIDPVLTSNELSRSATSSSFIHLASSDGSLPYKNFALTVQLANPSVTYYNTDLLTPYSYSDYITSKNNRLTEVEANLFNPGNILEIKVSSSSTAEPYTLYTEVISNNLTDVGTVHTSTSNNQRVVVVPYESEANLASYIGNSSTATKNIVRSIRVLPRVRNSVYDSQFTFVKSFNDVSPKIHWYYTGTKIGKFSLNFSTGSILKTTTSLMSRSSDMFEGDTSTATDVILGEHNVDLSSQDFIVPNTNPIMNAVDNVYSIVFDDDVSTSGSLFFNSLTLNLDNTLRGQKAVGHLAYVGIVPGKFVTSGSIELYFRDKSLFDRFKNSKPFSLSLMLKDSEGNCYFIKLPKAKFTNMDIVSNGLDQDVTAKADFSCLAYMGGDGENWQTQIART